MRLYLLGGSTGVEEAFQPAPEFHQKVGKMAAGPVGQREPDPIVARPLLGWVGS